MNSMMWRGLLLTDTFFCDFHKNGYDHDELLADLTAASDLLRAAGFNHDQITYGGLGTGMTLTGYCMKVVRADGTGGVVGWVWVSPFSRAKPKWKDAARDWLDAHLYNQTMEMCS